jgi:erythromycin esterase-like protein
MYPGRIILRVPAPPNHHTRNHRPTTLTLSPATLGRLDARVNAALATGRQATRSGEVARCVAEADGNAQRLRHDLRQPLQAMTLLVDGLAAHMRSAEDREAIQGLRWCLKQVAGMLEPPGR